MPFNVGVIGHNRIRIDFVMLNTYLRNPRRKCKIIDYEFENPSNQSSNDDQAEVIHPLATILPLQLRMWLYKYPISYFNLFPRLDKITSKNRCANIRLKN